MLIRTTYLVLPVLIGLRVKEVWERSDSWPDSTSEDIPIVVLRK